MKERQTQSMMNSQIRHLLIFPEGTVSSGKHLLNFKKGAFENMLPIKPYVVKSANKNFDLSCGVLSLPIHLIICLCFVFHKIEIYELAINPDEILNDKYNETFGDEKWKCFAEICQKIIADSIKIKISNKGFRDNIEYRDLLKRYVIISSNRLIL